ncbi:MAG: efflux RND transporter periplasmic adaptor subunit, partial [Candidatus Binatia bacterium]
ARLRETVRAVGTLVANESVEIVAELSRRLVRVHVSEGRHVAQGDVLFDLDDADLRASLAELVVRRRLAERTLERQRTLIAQEKKALSQHAYDQSRAELDSSAAQIAALEVTLAKTKLRAPFAGTIGLRRVSEGAWVTPTTVLTTLQDTSRVKVDFKLPERYAAAVAFGRSFEFTVAGRPERFTAGIVAVEPAIEAETRSVVVRGVADNAGAALFPGAFASIELPLEQAGGVMVPAEAVVPSVDGHSVFVLRDGRAELRKVEIGTRTAESVQVLRGLAEGETVLTSNLLRISPGAAVELEPRAADA